MSHRVQVTTTSQRGMRGMAVSDPRDNQGVLEIQFDERTRTADLLITSVCSASRRSSAGQHDLRRRLPQLRDPARDRRRRLRGLGRRGAGHRASVGRRHDGHSQRGRGRCRGAQPRSPRRARAGRHRARGRGIAGSRLREKDAPPAFTGRAALLKRGGAGGRRPGSRAPSAAWKVSGCPPAP